MSSASVDELPKLQGLVGHREFVRATDPLEIVHRRFAASRQDFLAVLEGHKLLGLCARREIGILLGARFGFALHARSPIASHLAVQPLRCTVEQPLTDLFNAVSRRRDEHFYDDVLLTDRHGEFLGLIYVRDLVRLQNTLLCDNLAEAAARNRRMEEDLRMAREVQVALLPREFPVCSAPSGGGLSFGRLFEPADGVSGDFFDVFAITEHQVGLIICDVMGHGVRSALVTAMVRTLLEELRPHAVRPGDFVTRLNTQLTRLLRRAGELIFVTLAFAVVDVAAQRMTYALAGHPAPLHWDGETRRASKLPELERIGGPAVGLVEDHVYEVGQIDFRAGDRLLLYTDGISEVANASEEEFGIERLAHAFESSARRELNETLIELRARAANFAQPQSFNDDVCLVACEFQR